MGVRNGIFVLEVRVKDGREDLNRRVGEASTCFCANSDLT